MTWYQRNSTDHPDLLLYHSKSLTQIRICQHIFETAGMGTRCLFCDFEPTLEQVVCYLNTNSFISQAESKT